jgi:hypothetical protein
MELRPLEQQNDKNKKQYHIIVDQKNHEILKSIGEFGESYNDVLTRILNNQRFEKG